MANFFIATKDWMLPLYSIDIFIVFSFSVNGFLQFQLHILGFRFVTDLLHWHRVEKSSNQRNMPHLISSPIYLISLKYQTFASINWVICGSDNNQLGAKPLSQWWLRINPTLRNTVTWQKIGIIFLLTEVLTKSSFVIVPLFYPGAEMRVNFLPYDWHSVLGSC